MDLPNFQLEILQSLKQDLNEFQLNDKNAFLSIEISKLSSLEYKYKQGVIDSTSSNYNWNEKLNNKNGFIIF
jgi:hypothetical protein